MPITIQTGAIFAGTGNLPVNAAGKVNASALFAGSGVLRANMRGPWRTGAVLTGAGALGANMRGPWAGAAALGGSGSLNVWTFSGVFSKSGTQVRINVDGSIEVEFALAVQLADMQAGGTLDLQVWIDGHAVDYYLRVPRLQIPQYGFAQLNGAGNLQGNATVVRGAQQGAALLAGAGALNVSTALRLSGAAWLGAPPAPVTIFDQTSNVNSIADSGNTGLSSRAYCAAFTLASGGTQARFTFGNINGGGTFTASHCSVGIWTGTGYNTVATPVELKFGGASGCSIPAGQTLVSDWVPISFASTDVFVVIVDITSAFGPDYAGNTASSSIGWYTGTTWSSATVAPSPTAGQNNNRFETFFKIEALAPDSKLTVAASHTPAGAALLGQGIGLLNFDITHTPQGAALLAGAGALATMANVITASNFRQAHYRFRTDTTTVDATPTWGSLEDA